MGSGRWWVGVMVGIAFACGIPRAASAQIGALVSPGRLSRAHASLEGIASCLSCHTAGRGVAADKCLACHKPIAERIAQKKGVHRAVGDECISCHVEHAGADAELRPFDQRRFDHAKDTGFALDGLHAPLAADCASCHKTRSFLSVSASCASCHTDAHKGTLGARCASCHTTSVKFAETRARFDHTRTAYPLIGAHSEVACASCHRSATTYKGVAFASCSDCHTDPHRQAFGASCASCHTPRAWRSTKVDHSRTDFPLVGRHAAVACAQCHAKPAMQVAPKADTCATCHADPHRGAFKQDCKACHNESGFQKGTFDHSTTRFALADKHAPLACVACHKNVTSGTRVAAARRNADFRGLKTECVSCHMDVHRAELGVACESCHSAKTFDVTTYAHARPRPFFEGQHAPLRCVQCHTGTQAPLPPSISASPARVGFTRTPDTCVTCHRDVHLGQVGDRCETCHTLTEARFAVARFAHDRTTFPLTGKHAPVACEKCHAVATRDFPSGPGTARQLTGIGTACAACHEDPHRGELQQGCERCHTVETFSVSKYTHLNARTLRAFFDGKHLSAACSACHKPAAATAGARGRMPAVRPARPPVAQTVRVAASPRPALTSFRVTTTCVDCHTDIHRGALGPQCERCHRP
jgi:hypothetical protein